MPKLDLVLADMIKGQGGDVQALKGPGFSWTKFVGGTFPTATLLAMFGNPPSGSWQDVFSLAEAETLASFWTSSRPAAWVTTNINDDWGVFTPTGGSTVSVRWMINRGSAGGQFTAAGDTQRPVLENKSVRFASVIGSGDDRLVHDIDPPLGAAGWVVAAQPDEAGSGYLGVVSSQGSGSDNAKLLLRADAAAEAVRWGTTGQVEQPANTALTVGTPYVLTMMPGAGTAASGEFFLNGSSDGVYGAATGQTPHVGGVSGQTGLWTLWALASIAPGTPRATVALIERGFAVRAGITPWW